MPIEVNEKELTRAILFGLFGCPRSPTVADVIALRDTGDLLMAQARAHHKAADLATTHHTIAAAMEELDGEDHD